MEGDHLVYHVTLKAKQHVLGRPVHVSDSVICQKRALSTIQPTTHTHTHTHTHTQEFQNNKTMQANITQLKGPRDTRGRPRPNGTGGPLRRAPLPAARTAPRPAAGGSMPARPATAGNLGATGASGEGGTTGRSAGGPLIAAGAKPETGATLFIPAAAAKTCGCKACCCFCCCCCCKSCSCLRCCCCCCCSC